VTTENLERAFASTRGVLANVSPAQYDEPTPCESWDVRQLVNHFVGAAYFYAAAMETGEAPETRNRNFAAGSAVAAYDEGIAAALAAFDVPGAMEKLVTLPFGEVNGFMAMNMLTTDAFQHGWDLARATNQSTDLDPELAAGLLEGVKVALTDDVRGADGTAPFGPPADASAGRTKADELAAFLGRRV
jgi:uncharacterized protein (TIGR03086 family)